MAWPLDAAHAAHAARWHPPDGDRGPTEPTGRGRSLHRAARDERRREQPADPAQDALAELFGPIPELLEESLRDDLPDDFALALAQARTSGYGNCFEAVASDVVWRPQLPGSDGRSHPRPTAPGAQTAIVVGPDGNDTATGADELYCDRLGRVRIRYHWQDGGDATCWVRVAQRLAGGGIGSQFLPASARKSSSSSSRTISIARSSSARCTTARARAA